MSDEQIRAQRKHTKKTQQPKHDRFDSRARRMARNERKSSLANVRARESME